MVRLAPIQRAEFRIYAQKPDAHVRRHLMMDIGEPCLLLWRRTWVGESVATRCSCGIRRRVSSGGERLTRLQAVSLVVDVRPRGCGLARSLSLALRHIRREPAAQPVARARMHEARERHRHAARPGAAHRASGTARRREFPATRLRHASAGRHRRRVRRRAPARSLNRYSDGRIAEKSCCEKLGRGRRIDVTVFELHRHAVLAMHADHVKHRSARREAKRVRHRRPARSRVA